MADRGDQISALEDLLAHPGWKLLREELQKEFAESDRACRTFGNGEARIRYEQGKAAAYEHALAWPAKRAEELKKNERHEESVRQKNEQLMR